MNKFFNLSKYKCTICNTIFNYSGYSGGWGTSPEPWPFQGGDIVEFCPNCQKNTIVLQFLSKKDKKIRIIVLAILTIILLIAIFINIKRLI